MSHIAFQLDSLMTPLCLPICATKSAFGKAPNGVKGGGKGGKAGHITLTVALHDDNKEIKEIGLGN